MMDKFTKVSRIIGETMNCSAGINAYESLPTKTKDFKIKKNYDKTLKGIVSNKKKI
jgi:hypothetical protein